jgi:hypothetical protein
MKAVRSSNRFRFEGAGRFPGLVAGSKKMMVAGFESERF